MRNRTKVLLVGSGVLGLIMILLLPPPSGWITGFEGQVRLLGYDTSNWDSETGTPKTFAKDTVSKFIDPDGLAHAGPFKIDRGTITGLQIDVTQPAMVNYVNNKYSSVPDRSKWEPSEYWIVNINGQDYEINVYRMLFALTIVTATQGGDITEEYDSIQNLKIRVRVEIPEWRGVESANIRMGFIYTPREWEVAGTPYDPPIKTDIIGFDRRSAFQTFMGFGLSFNQEPSISPTVPGRFYSGTADLESLNPLDPNPAVNIAFEWSSIAPGIQDIDWLGEKRAEVFERVNVIVAFMASRPLYVGGHLGGADDPELPEKPLVCDPFFEAPQYNNAGEIIGCTQVDIWANMKFMGLLAVGVIGGVVVLALFLKFVVFRRR